MWKAFISRHPEEGTSTYVCHFTTYLMFYLFSFIDYCKYVDTSDREDCWMLIKHLAQSASKQVNF